MTAALDGGGPPNERDPILRMPRPTPYPPGSPEKVEILAERFARGEFLFHPDDAKGGGYVPDVRTRGGYHRGNGEIETGPRVRRLLVD
jgi:hypothetical protein